MNVSPNQGGNVTIDQTTSTTYPTTITVANGNSVNLEAIPADGYEFAGWSGSLIGLDNPVTLLMSCSKSVTASFIQVEGFRLTIEVNGAGSVSPYAGIHYYAQGTVVDINAIPESGYQFYNWMGEVGDTASAKTTVTMDSDKTIVANFSGTTYNLTVEVNGVGSVTPSIGIHRYVEGTVVNITATPEKGYQFDSWTGNVSDANSAKTTVTMDSDKTIVAKFTRIMHSLVIEVNGAGSVIPSGHTPGRYRYSEGSTVNITAIPDPGYQFEGWTGGVVDPASANTTVTMDSDKTIVANFSGITYTLTIETKGEGSVSPSIGNHSYTAGTVVNITATPDSGYRFDNWTGNVSDANSASTTVTIDSDKTVTANFSKAQPTGLILGTSIGGAIVVIGGIIWLISRRRRARA